MPEPKQAPAPTAGRERRTLIAADHEMRIERREGVGGPGTLVGYAAVFGPLSEDLGGFREQVDPAAFNKAIARCDVRSLVNHDPNKLLGRTSSGTLRLSVDAVGLRSEVDLPDTPLGREVATLVERRDITGQSFTFTTAADSWEYGATILRTLLEVAELYDVGPVTYPAYVDTSVALRSLDANRPAPPPAPRHAAAIAALDSRIRVLDPRPA